MNLFNQQKDVFIHVGPSMNPTLRAADIVKVVPYNGNKIKVGDVIVFRSPHKPINISHRVIRVENDSIFTQGDNNSRPDSFRVKPQAIIGQVIFADRGKRQLSIYGGPAGRVFARWARLLRSIKLTLFFLLRPFYRLAVKLSPLKLTPQVFIFESGQGRRAYLLLGKKVVGGRRRRKWQIYPPYKLIIKEPAGIS